MVTTKYESLDGYGLFACSDINRHKCPNLRNPDSQRNNEGGDALTP